MTQLSAGRGRGRDVSVPMGPRGGGRGGVGRTECAGARAQGKRRRPARRVGEGSSRKPGRPGVPPPGLPGRESVGDSGFRHLGGGSLKAFRILECQHCGISDLVSWRLLDPGCPRTFRNRRTVASGFPGSQNFGIPESWPVGIREARDCEISTFLSLGNSWSRAPGGVGVAASSGRGGAPGRAASSDHTR